MEMALRLLLLLKMLGNIAINELKKYYLAK
jgi:hypothetical protein